MDIKLKFGNRLKRLREENEISQEKLAYKAGIHRTYLSSVERGERNISLVNIEKIAEALSIEISELFNNI